MRLTNKKSVLHSPPKTLLYLSLLLSATLAGRGAEPTDTPQTDTTQTESSSFLGPVGDYFANWFEHVDRARATQPHWVPPVFTTSPNLQEVFRYDIFYQTSMRNGYDLANFGGGKGFEFILSERMQLNIGIPAYLHLDSSPARTGWGDENFLYKYRLFAAPEKEGDYVVTLFAGLTAPTGTQNFTGDHFVFSPALAFGKGWDDFNIQGTLGSAIPDNGASTHGTGTPFISNTVFQYRIAKYFWPQVEFNYTYWPNGRYDGLNQLFITPGLVLGKFQVYKRLGFMVGIGCQIAATDDPLYKKNFILTFRMPF